MNPNALHAVRLANSLHHLVVARIPAIRDAEAYTRAASGQPETRTYSPRALARQGAQIAEERAERVETMQKGGKPAGNGKVPMSSSLLDADALGRSTLDGAMWFMASALRLRPAVAWSYDWRAYEQGNPVDTARLYISACACALSPKDALVVVKMLRPVERHVRGLTHSEGADQSRVTLKRSPCCDQRSLIWHRVGPESTHMVTCSNECLCTGNPSSCPCGMTDHVRGVPTIWHREAFK